MSFEPRKYNAIFDEMRSRTAPVVSDFEVGSVARTMAESFSYELALLYEKMNLVYLSAYVDSANGIHLDNVVAVLGIRRGLPDFATGIVTFGRDRGNDDLQIPLTTLVATEEGDGKPKKVFQTIEPATLAKNEATVDVKIQALLGGETEATPAATIAVMPRPIPGVKTVVNKDAIKFTGKRRETDDELRERAKNALISSGKASIIAIENTLLALPSVRDVRVRENFHAARATLHLQKTGSDSFTPPRIFLRGTRLVATLGVGPNAKNYFFKTVGETQVSDQVDVRIQAEIKGRASEFNPTDAANLNWAFENTALNTDLKITLRSPIALSEFGIIEVFVDVPEFETRPDLRNLIEETLEKTRAAGIFAILEPARPIETDGVFRIAAGIELAGEERAAFENTVKGELENWFAAQKMGEPLNFGKLVKAILSVENVDTLIDFKLKTIRRVGSMTIVPPEFVFSNQSIDIDESEIFRPRDLCIASEDKFLPVDVEFKATGLMTPGLDDAALQIRFDSVKTALDSFFASKQRGDFFTRSEVETTVEDVGGIGPAAFKITPRPWCARTHAWQTENSQPDRAVVSFVEQPALGTLFFYTHELEITGALKLILSGQKFSSEIIQIRAAARTAAVEYLDALGPEQPLVLPDLVAAILQKEPQISEVAWQKDDFTIKKSTATVNEPTAIDKDKISIEKWQKAVFKNLLLTTNQADKTLISLLGNLQVEVVFDKKLSAPEKTALADSLKNKISVAFNSFLSEAAPGDKLSFPTLVSALQNLEPGLNYSLKNLEIEAVSPDPDQPANRAAARIQTANLTNPSPIQIRSVEVGVMKPITAAAIVVTEK